MKPRATANETPDALGYFIARAYDEGLCKIPDHLQPPYDRSKMTALSKCGNYGRYKKKKIA